MGNLDCKFFYNHNFTKIKEKMKKLFLDSVFWKSPGKTHFHSVDCSISVHSVLRTPCTEKEQSTPWKWFYLTFSRKLHKKLLFPPGLTFLASVFWTFLPYFSDPVWVLRRIRSPYLIKKLLIRESNPGLLGER